MSDLYHSRQTFLGARLPQVLKHARLAVVGVSGGGSHIVQQLAHVGFRNFSLFDPDGIRRENLHRHVGATLDDVAVECPKVEIGARVIRSLWPEAHVDVVKSKWQDAVELLRQADLIFACVDSARSRLDLETTARRYLIPVIDIGLGLRELQDGPRLHGQVALSMPGGPCLRCLKVLTPAELDADTRRSAYPGFGPAPQVVWSNGVLAATAVGVAMDLLTGWNRLAAPHPLIKYGGNECLVAESVQVPPLTCTHYPAGELGDP